MIIHHDQVILSTTSKVGLMLQNKSIYFDISDKKKKRKMFIIISINAKRTHVNTNLSKHRTEEQMGIFQSDKGRL